jgi:hypothetical protein
MFVTPTTQKNVCQRARAVYEDRLRPLVESEHMHQYIAIEPDTGEYAIGQDLGGAIDKLKERRPNAVTCLLRIGHKAAITGIRGRSVRDSDEPPIAGAVDYDIFWSRSQAIYDAEIRPWVEAPHKGKFLALHPDTRDCEVHEDLLIAVDNLSKRLPGAPFYVLRVGHDDSVTGVIRGTKKQ